jgi:pimeloyl-ACP methyl ester carboxylesterase
MAGNIISSLAFQPPAPATYKEDMEGLFFARGIACMAYPIGLPYKFTILYSHGNAEDLGLNREYMAILSDRLGVNMVTYDYEGYGLTLGRASEQGCYNSAEVVLDTLHVDPKFLIIAGRSLGSGPAIHLACNFQCAGLVLISPLLSAARVVLSDSAALALEYGDIFLNHRKIDKVTCPALVIHGFMDDVVPWRHGSELAKKCQNLWKMVSISIGTHNNRATTLGAIDDIKAFIDFLEACALVSPEQVQSPPRILSAR